MMTSIEAYIANKPDRVQRQLRAVYGAVRAAAPDALATIAYGMPAFKRDGVLLAFGAFKAHIGFYPGAEAIRTFASELRAFTTAKGSVRFPLDRPMPIDLIERITRRVLATDPKRKAE